MTCVYVLCSADHVYFCLCVVFVRCSCVRSFAIAVEDVSDQSYSSVGCDTTTVLRKEELTFSVPLGRGRFCSVLRNGVGQGVLRGGTREKFLCRRGGGSGTSRGAVRME